MKNTEKIIILKNRLFIFKVPHFYIHPMIAHPMIAHPVTGNPLIDNPEEICVKENH
jgi:hypothetical protein